MKIRKIGTGLLAMSMLVVGSSTAFAGTDIKKGIPATKITIMATESAKTTETEKNMKEMPEGAILATLTVAATSADTLPMSEVDSKTGISFIKILKNQNANEILIDGETKSTNPLTVINKAIKK